MTKPYQISPKVRITRLLIVGAFQLLYRVLTRLEFTGLENIPKAGPYVIIFNHVSYYDPPLVAVFWPQKPEILGAGYLWETSFAPIMKMYGVIPISRGEYNRDVLKTSIDILSSDKLLMISPEGTRSGKPGLVEAKPGVAYLVEKGNCPIVPVGITGTTSDLFQRAIRFRRPEVLVRIGKPFELPPIEAGISRKEARQKNSDILMMKIAELLPEEYQGKYSHLVQ
jgi:1-acyl-sn-glycerol-3-phosphate acyltransferase